MSFMPEPERDMDKPFLMPIEDVFTITGRGTVVTGRVEQGILKSVMRSRSWGSGRREDGVDGGGDVPQDCWMRAGRATTSGCCCGGRGRRMWSGVRCWRSRGRITPHTDFEAQVYVLTKEEGGRHTPFFTNYRPQFYFRTTDVTGTVQLPEGTQMVMPGDNTQMTVELINPIAMEEGLRFAIREGGRTVGAGRVIKIIK